MFVRGQISNVYEVNLAVIASSQQLLEWLQLREAKSPGRHHLFYGTGRIIGTGVSCVRTASQQQCRQLWLR